MPVTDLTSADDGGHCVVHHGDLISGQVVGFAQERVQQLQGRVTLLDVGRVQLPRTQQHLTCLEARKVRSVMSDAPQAQCDVGVFRFFVINRGSNLKGSCVALLARTAR